MKFSDFEKELNKSILKPVYIFCATELFFIDNAISTLKTYLYNRDKAEPEKDHFDARYSKIPEIINLTSTYPFLSVSRLIIVRNFDYYFKFESTKKELSYLDSYFNEPSEFSVLVLIADKLDKRLKITSCAVKKGFLYEFDKPRDYELPNIIKSELKRKFNKQIDDDGALLLAELTGNNLSALNMELEKLALYTGEKKSICNEEVSQIVGGIPAIDNFKMVDSLALKDIKNALYLLYKILNTEQEKPERLMGLLKWQFRRLYSAKLSMANGATLDKIMSEYNIFPSHRAKFTSQLNNFSLENISKIYNHLYTADRKMKSTGGDPNFLIEQFFCSVLS